MNKVNRKKQKNEKGFTMIELIIVVAIMGIIGAVLVPTFSNMSTKARLTTDVTTIKTLQRQIDIYKAAVGSYPKVTGETKAFDELANEAVTPGMIQKLVDEGYVDAKDLVSASGGYTLRLQTGGTLKANAKSCYLELDSTDQKEYIDAIKKLDNNDSIRAWTRDEDGAAITLK